MPTRHSIRAIAVAAIAAVLAAKAAPEGAAGRDLRWRPGAPGGGAVDNVLRNRSLTDKFNSATGGRIDGPPPPPPPPGGGSAGGGSAGGGPGTGSGAGSGGLTGEFNRVAAPPRPNHDAPTPRLEPKPDLPRFDGPSGPGGLSPSVTPRDVPRQTLPSSAPGRSPGAPSSGGGQGGGLTPTFNGAARPDVRL